MTCENLTGTGLSYGPFLVLDYPLFLDHVLLQANRLSHSWLQLHYRQHLCDTSMVYICIIAALSMHHKPVQGYPACLPYAVARFVVHLVVHFHTASTGKVATLE